MKPHGFGVMVPHYIPAGIKLSAVYYKCCPLVVIIAYSDRDVKDYRYANIAIEIMPSTLYSQHLKSICRG
jgi:hypothetical protein